MGQFQMTTQPARPRARNRPSRRTITGGAAWAVPSVVLASRTAHAATSTPCGSSAAHVTFAGSMYPISTGGTTQVVGTNWVWRSSGSIGFRIPPVATTNSVWGWGMSLHNPGATCTTDTPGCTTVYNTASNAPQGCQVVGVNPPLTLPYYVFKGDPLYPAPTQNPPPTQTTATFMAIHTKALTVCAGCTYSFTITWWADGFYARDLKAEVGWITTTNFPTASTSANPPSWLSGPKIVRGTNGTATTGTITVPYTPTGAGSAMVLIKVTADTANDVAWNDNQSCNGGVNDIVFNAPYLQVSCP